MLVVTGAAVVASVLAVATAGAVLVAGQGAAKPASAGQAHTYARAASVTVAEGLASELAAAIAHDAGTVTGAAFTELPPEGTPNAVFTSSLGGFPTDGSSFAILTSGDASLASTPNDSGGSGTDDGGPSVRGNTDFDVTVLRIDLAVPAGANCLSFAFKFLSEEFPEFVGSSVNDAFVAELDESNWTTVDSEIIAPRNFAFDPQGNVISVNSTGVTGMSAADSAGTTYDGGTSLLSASTPIAAGAHSLFLSIFDQGDGILDSAVFVDRLVLGTAAEGACVAGATSLTAAIAADEPESPPGGGNGYTITVANHSSTAATLDTISAVLPAGFAYVAGTTTGGTTADPAIQGQTLTWTGTFPVAGNGSATLHFDVVVSSTPGTYQAEASAGGDGVKVAPSGPGAPITVTEPSEPADLAAAIAADQAQSAPGATNGYTVTISNPNAGEATLTSISAVLPAGFSYVAGSTSGVTTDEPTPDGSMLTWSGSFPVAGGGSASLHFDVVVSSTPGTYTAEASAAGEGVSVTPSGPGAPITVTEPAPPADLTAAIAADAPESEPGAANGYTITIGNPGEVPATLDTISAVLPEGFSYVPGTTTGVATSEPSILGQMLTWSGSFAVEETGSVSLHFGVLASSTPGTYLAEATASGEGISVTPSGPSAPITVAEPSAPPPPGNQPPQPANLSLSLSTSAPTAGVGDAVAFAGNVTNHGPGPAFSVTVVGTLSQTVSLTAARTEAGPCPTSGNAFTCSIGTLQPGGSATVTADATVVSPGNAVATMTASAQEEDPEQANNSGSATIAAPSGPTPPGPFQPPVPPQELPPPQPGRTVNVTPVRGIVLVNGVRLREGEQIPVGAIVDTRKGRVELESANGTAIFRDGLFRIIEPRVKGGFTELRLLGGNFLAGCDHRARNLSLSETHRKKVVRRLWGNGTGRFRTTGRFSSATVRGTIWLTADRCDGTLTSVRRGSVVVFDTELKKRIVVGAGKSYLARPSG